MRCVRRASRSSRRRTATAIHDAAIEASRTLAGEGAAIRLCEGFDGGTDEFIVVAADGDTGDAIGARFSLDVLQEWKRQRLLDRDAYVVQTHESTIREPLRPPRPRGGLRARRTVVHARRVPRHDGRGDPRGDAVVGRRQPPGALVAGGARAGERGAHGGPAAASERGAVRVAGQELLGRGGGRSSRPPWSATRARPLLGCSEPTPGSWRARASSTSCTRTTRRGCCRSSRPPATGRATPASWSSACAIATAPTSRPRPCARACCTTRTSAGSCSTPVTSRNASSSNGSWSTRRSTTR